MIGRTLAHFKIVDKLGEGGMGEVYRAEDTKLGREVAIKVLPALFTEDPERLARFEREAKVLAALNHPNIAGIYEVGEAQTEADSAATCHFLAMEMAAGEDLAQRLERGALPLDETLRIVVQVASGLEAAHSRGIVHRDLKPANIMVATDGSVKVLDFGLAKAWESDTDTSANLSLSPTLTAQMTQQGVLLGTAAYMSPEQARGEVADARTDVWALGIVLMEMLTGETVYRGKTVSDSLAGILAREPNWDALPDDTPAAIRNLLDRCLEKEASERLQAVGEVRIAINRYLADPEKDVAPAGPEPERAALSGRSKAILAASCLLLSAALFAVGWILKPEPSAVLDGVRVEALLEAPRALFAGQASSIVFSPDGQRLAYVSGSSGGVGGRKIHLRPLGQYDAQDLSGTEGGYNPVFSPDGNWIAFVTPSALKKVAISGGAPLDLCAVNRARGSTWGEDNTIVFAPNPASGLFRVSAAGGEPTELTVLEEGEVSHRWPQFLPGGDKILYTAYASGDRDEGSIKVVDIESGQSKIVHRGGTYARHTTSGHILYWREGTVFAAPFDLEALEMKSLPAPVLQRVTGNAQGGAMYDVSVNGTLAYLEGDVDAAQELPRRLTWVEPDGDVEPASESTGQFLGFYLSPSEEMAVTARVSDGNVDLWLLDLSRDTFTRLTFHEAQDLEGRFSADGRFVYFSSDRDGRFQIYRKATDGSADAERVFDGENEQWVSDVSPDGEFLVYEQRGTDTLDDLVALRLDGSGETIPIVVTRYDEDQASLSPDGKWISYDSNESGQWEVYVRPFPGPGGKWQVSRGGGEFSRWSADGSSIFYRDLEGTIMTATVDAGANSLRIGTPEEIFRPAGVEFLGDWDIAADGRFLFTANPQVSSGSAEANVNLVKIAFNWHRELDQLLLGR